jgi:hypothetical protein
METELKYNLNISNYQLKINVVNKLTNELYQMTSYNINNIRFDYNQSNDYIDLYLNNFKIHSFKNNIETINFIDVYNTTSQYKYDLIINKINNI